MHAAASLLQAYECSCEVDISKLVMYYEYDLPALNDFLFKEYGRDLSSVLEPGDDPVAHAHVAHATRTKRMTICSSSPAVWDEVRFVPARDASVAARRETASE
jgi:hypothetical protein